MNRKITIEERDDTQSGGSRQPQSNQSPPALAAQMGQRGDTQLAHVNPWEAMLLKMLGGAGTINPRTGLRQFYYDDYYAQKVAQLNTLSPAEQAEQKATFGITGAWTPEAVRGAFTQVGLTPEQHWARYGQAEGLSAPYAGTYTGAAATPGATATSMFNMPLDLKPTSTSSSSSYSGLPQEYQTQLLSALMPQLTSAITNMPGNIDEYTKQAMGQYQQELQDALRTNMPTAIQGLANRGIIDSTMGQNILRDVEKAALLDMANKGYTTAMQAASLKAQMPTQLGTLADLGKMQTTVNSSYQDDPTVMYRTIANMLTALM